MADITNGSLLELWRNQENPSGAGSTATVKLILDFIRNKVGDEWPSEDESFEKTLVGRIKGFCSTLYEKWKTASRSHSVFITQNENWLRRNFVVTIVKNKPLEPQPSTSGTGRPKKDFLSSSERTKRRKVQGFKDATSPEEIIFAAKTVLRDTGKRAAADLMTQATELSPGRPVKIRKLLRESSKLREVIPYTADEGLALLMDTRVSKDSYHRMRLGAKTQYAPNLYPSYDRIREAKQHCYPSGIIIDKFGASVLLQNLLKHTVMRLIEIIDFPNYLNPNSLSKIDLICKYGCDGSSGHSEYMQIPKTNPEPEESERETITDANLFLFSLVPLRLLTTVNHTNDRKEDQKLTLWKNTRPSSTNFCRPIKFKYMKETAESISNENDILNIEISELKPYQVVIKGELVEVNFTLQLTMVDGKVINALTHTSSQSCYICKCKPTQMNDLESIKKFSINALRKMSYLNETICAH